jgi:hypothetical protein
MDDEEMMFIANVDGRAFAVTLDPDDPGRWLTKAEVAAEQERRRRMSEFELARHWKVRDSHWDEISRKVAAACIDFKVSDVETDATGIGFAITARPRVPVNAPRAWEELSRGGPR